MLEKVKSINMKKRTVRDLKIHQRLLIAFFSLTFFPMAVTSILTYNHSKNDTKEKITSYSVQLLQSASLQLEAELYHLEGICEELTMIDEVQNSLMEIDKSDYLEYFQITSAINQKFIEKMRISTLGMSSDITSIDMLLADGTIIGAGQNNYAKDQLERLYKYSFESDEKFIYRMLLDLNGDYEVAVVMNVTNHRTGEQIGVMVLTFKESYISDTCYSLDLADKAEIYIVDYDGFIISSNQTRQFVNYYLFNDAAPINEMLAMNEANQFSRIDKDSNSQYLSVFTNIKSANWLLVGMVPKAYIQRESQVLMWQIIIIGVTCMLVTIPVAIMISTSISTPVQRLRGLMAMATQGQLDVEDHDTGADEISEISNSFNLMMAGIRDLVKENMDTRREIVYKLGEIIEVRSKETGNHIQRVALYTKTIALKIGIAPDEAENLKMASTLHDIGKVAIPDHILLKPGKLSDEEFDIMKTHTQVGYDVLANSKKAILIMAATVALEHHERYDGSGYPNGIKGNDISVHSRIVALADVFDALGSKRVYKDSWEIERILEYVHEQKGVQFDPEIVDAFFSCLSEILWIKERFRD